MRWTVRIAVIFGSLFVAWALLLGLLLRELQRVVAAGLIG